MLYVQSVNQEKNNKKRENLEKMLQASVLDEKAKQVICSLSPITQFRRHIGFFCFGSKFVTRTNRTSHFVIRNQINNISSFFMPHEAQCIRRDRYLNDVNDKMRYRLQKAVIPDDIFKHVPVRQKAKIRIFSETTNIHFVLFLMHC